MDRSNVGTINLQRQDPYLDGRQLDALIGLWLDDCADRLEDLVERDISRRPLQSKSTAGTAI